MIASSIMVTPTVVAAVTAVVVRLKSSMLEIYPMVLVLI